MLQLQRASAGSGKTYTLTKIYIRNFLAKKVNNRYRLRTEAEMRAVHGRILAITFTNKATNEMKQRIVTALANLAGLYSQEDEKIDYLSDFIKEFSATKKQVQQAALLGLNILLHGYSDFQISTIDSFFQSILRTLAVETDRNESYQIELDDNYLSQVGVDMTLSEVNDNSSRKKSDAKFWIQTLILDMLRNGEGWNPFTKSKNGLYAELVNFTNLFHSEVFKENVEAELMKYLTSDIDFMEVYRELKRSHKECHEEYKEAYLESRKEILEMLNREGCTFNSLNGRYYGRLWRRESDSDFTDLPIGKVKFEFGNSIMSLEGVDEENAKILSGSDKKKADALQGLASMLCDHRDLMLEWEILDRFWSATNGKLYYLGLIKSIKENIRQFREENNIIPLSETNRILQGIINEDDAPFIYERVGTYINNYLIDEFQDTSRLQWSNLCPLVSESLSHEEDYDNLIIGDVKQSIYRFRNAEPMLIQKDVPERFYCEIRGESVDENTNWRSNREIVKFNNSFFYRIAHTLDYERGADESDSTRLKISSLYNNAIQKIKNIDKPGYVEVNFIGDRANAYEEMGDLVHHLLDKGYEQRDIAFLVNNANHGVRLIDALMAYNADEKNVGKTPISIISEQSLKISGSSAVKLVVAVLQLIVKGNAKKGLKSDNRRYRKVEMDEFISSYNYIYCNNPDLSATEIIEHYFSDDSNIDVSDILKEVYTVALPALVENIIIKVVPEKLRQSDVAFLSAFQDKVLEYCQMYPTDIASFVRWWNDIGADNSSISSPEDTDAVQVMTIHKSKGLEFKCVIIPHADWSLDVTKSSTIWVRPKLPKNIEITDMPPYLPIEMNNALKDTLYNDDYEQEFDRIIVDQLNKTYVAFTRAVNELYIYAPSTKKADTTRIGDYLKRIVPQMYDTKLLDPSEIEFTVKENDIIIDDSGELLTYRMGGVTPEDVRKSKDKSDESKSDESESDDKEKIADYHVNTKTKLLMTDSEKDAEDDNEVSLDNAAEKESKESRRRGRLLHSIMEQVIVADDLPAAIRRMKIVGRLKGKDADEVEAFLKAKMADEKVAKWFDKDLDVITERTILCSDDKNRRPDRIVVSKEGDLEVIDYKFGEQLNDNYNTQQVRRYIKLLREIKAEDGSPKYRSVRGYLWYVSLGIVKPVDSNITKRNTDR